MITLASREIEVIPGGFPTYSGSTATFTPPATPTDLFYIGGAIGKLIKIWRIWISSTQTSTGINNLFLIKRSAANTAGTAVATTKVPLDSNDAAAAAVVQHYTANPTINGTVGNVWSGKITSPVATGLVQPVFTLDFPALIGKPIFLRSAAEALAWNFGGADLPGGLTVQAGCIWTEE
jgi:predicted acetyltransferase